MPTATVRSSASAPAPSRIDAWWRRRIGYPLPGQPYRATGTLDLLKSLRRIARSIAVLVAVLVGAMALAVAGYPIPGWLTPVIGAVGAWLFVFITPHSRDTLFSLALSHRDRWAADWEEAGAPFVYLWCMLRPPVDRGAFAAYHQVLGSDETARIHGGTDPRLVWWLHAHQISPDRAQEYLDAGVPAEHLPHVLTAGFTPAQWCRVAPVGKPEHVLRSVAWFRHGNRALHPIQFGQQATLDEAIRATVTWDERGLDSWYWRACYDPDVPKTKSGQTCEVCGVTGGHGDLAPARTLRGMGDRTVAQWTEATGILGPWFIEAGISYDEAVGMVAEEPGAVTEETLETLAALRRQGT